MDFSIIKAVHIIFVVSYFAGLFYIVRLFIYHTETQNKENLEQGILQKQFTFMESRLWDIITVPSGLIVLFTGLTMLYWRWEYFLDSRWIFIKLGFVVILILYHFWSWKTLRQLKKRKFHYTSIQLRMLNEVATLLLFIIVFIAILKTQFMSYWYWVLCTFFGFGVLIMMVVRLVNQTKK